MEFEEYYLPFELAAKLALLGFNESCSREWMRDPNKRRLKPRTCHSYHNFDDWELYKRNSGPEDHAPAVDRVLNRQASGMNFKYIFLGRNVAAPMNQQALDWFREKYEIDVMQIRKSSASGFTYICDPVGPGIGEIRLEECKTPHAAVVQCIAHLISILKPLENAFYQEEEELEQETCEVGPED
jgi:hypothetical protein